MANSSEGLTSLLRASGLGGGDSLNTHMTSLADQLQQQQTYQRRSHAADVGGDGAAGERWRVSGDRAAIRSWARSAVRSGACWAAGLGWRRWFRVSRVCFGGGDSSAPAALPTYMAPLPINLDAGFSEGGGGAFGVDAAQGGAPRAMTNSSSPQITVQVQAMDSQSFLDHSGDIALAVRQAMLQSSVLNDVIREV